MQEPLLHLVNSKPSALKGNCKKPNVLKPLNPGCPAYDFNAVQIP